MAAANFFFAFALAPRAISHAGLWVEGKELFLVALEFVYAAKLAGSDLVFVSSCITCGLPPIALGIGGWSLS
jgi:hypothetical protein